MVTAVKQIENVVRMQNIIDICDNSLVYDKQYDSAISFVKRAYAQQAAPNVLESKEFFYGRFVMQLFKDGKIDGKPNMYDPRLAAMSAAPGDSLSKIKLFVAVVYIPELHFVPFPKKDDYKAIQDIALNGGLFLSYVYLLNGGTVPTHGDNVLVSFGNMCNRTQGIFEHPEVEGAGAASGAPGMIMMSGLKGFACPTPSIKTPKPKKSKNTKSTKKDAKGATKKEKKKVTSKPKKPSKKEVNKQTPAKKTMKQPPCPLPFGAVGTPLAWVRIQGNPRVHLRTYKGPGVQYGTAKLQAWLNGLTSVPGGNNVANMPGLANMAPGYRVGDVSRINGGTWPPPPRNSQHKTHQSGIDCDISIPKINGGMSIAPSKLPGGWGFKSLRPNEIDIESCLMFLVYTMKHAKQIIWDPGHIEVAKAAAQSLVKSGHPLMTRAVYRKLFVGSGHVVRFLDGHANHFHVQMKGPGVGDKNGNGRLD